MTRRKTTKKVSEDRMQSRRSLRSLGVPYACVIVKPTTVGLRATTRISPSLPLNDLRRCERYRVDQSKRILGTRSGDPVALPCMIAPNLDGQNESAHFLVCI
jgi:hypothetical protein